MSFFNIYGTLNNLLQAVREDLNENILDLNPVIDEIQRNCLSWSEDSPSLLFDQKPGFEGADVHKDEVYNALFAP